MDFQPKVFKSLNCSKCSGPFSKSVNDRNGPRKFPNCGLTVCTQCFEDIKRQRQAQYAQQPQYPHYQSHGCSFDGNNTCRFDATKPAYFLIGLLNSPSFAESSYGNGYYLTKQFDIPECMICQEEYSLETEDRKPCDLMCNHTICFGCVKKTGQQKNDGHVGCYTTKCPICVEESFTFAPSASRKTNSLIEFLSELPEMTKQIETIKGKKGRRQLRLKKVNTGKIATTFSPTIEITDHFDCPECVREFPIEDMFSCSDCSQKICGSCVTRRHREHKLTDLFVEETRRISKETKEMVSIQINGYKKIFPELHQQLVERIASFEKVLVDKAEEIANLENLEKTTNEFDECKDYAEKFEQISEEYLPNLRSFDTNLQNLIDEIKNAKISKNEAEKK